MKKIRASLLTVFATAALAGTAQAQSLPISLEVRGGAGFPTGDMADGVETGFGFDANAKFHFTPMLAIYGGYSWMEFGTEDDPDLPAVEVDVTDQGFNAGLHASLAGLGGLGGASPWLRGGVVFHELEIGGEGFETSSERSTGFEVGGGLAFALGPNLTVTPGVRYVNYGAESGSLDGDELDVTYVVADVGLSFRLGR